MKNLLSILALAAVVVLSGCKKGEEDPFLSFSSRDGRLAGTWTLSSGTFNLGYTYSNGAEDDPSAVVTDYDYNYELDGSNAAYSYTQTLNGAANGDASSSIPFTIEVTFDKEGTYTAHIVASYPVRLDGGGALDDYNQTSSGHWSWVNDGKNKVGLRLQQSAGGPVLGEPSLMNGNYRLKKLSGSEMIMTRDESFKEVRTGGVGGGGAVEVITNTQASEFTMTKSE